MTTKKIYEIYKKETNTNISLEDIENSDAEILHIIDDYKIVGFIVIEKNTITHTFVLKEYRKKGLMENCIRNYIAKHPGNYSVAYPDTSGYMYYSTLFQKIKYWPTYLLDKELKTKDANMKIVSFTPSPKITTPNIDDYIILKHKRPELFSESNIYPIIDPEKNIAKIFDYEKQTGKKIGINYKSEHNILAVDLIDGDTPFTYERLIPTNPGGIVIVPKYKDKFVLLTQYRHPIRTEQICFPRGYADPNIDNIENIKKELKEEIGTTTINNTIYLGEITPDSGILSSYVSVYIADIVGYNTQNHSEGIKNINLYTKEEIETMIRSGNIKDSFTISAMYLYSLNQ